MSEQNQLENDYSQSFETFRAWDNMRNQQLRSLINLVTSDDAVVRMWYTNNIDNMHVDSIDGPIDYTHWRNHIRQNWQSPTVGITVNSVRDMQRLYRRRHGPIEQLYPDIAGYRTLAEPLPEPLNILGDALGAVARDGRRDYF